MSNPSERPGHGEEIGHVYETCRAGWCATHKANYTVLTLTGFRSKHLGTSERFPGMEIVGDRNGDKILGVVHNTLSVDFLTQVREKYGHQ
ncbi:hypothetical protein [Streptomyces halobius]|uniref:Uncharacterized protein n=1 Tax=Streptomyces halobius TaxID=2879846 RepID=A0ABY4M0G5_9ACTN|nr:hypothetical protein [Streptomyces halobius]UQA91249.1 hypothetical protein K9S39_04590 [Streptomyces halobius]